MSAIVFKISKLKHKYFKEKHFISYLYWTQVDFELALAPSLSKTKHSRLRLKTNRLDVVDNYRPMDISLSADTFDTMKCQTFTELWIEICILKTIQVSSLWFPNTDILSNQTVKNTFEHSVRLLGGTLWRKKEGSISAWDSNLNSHSLLKSICLRNVHSKNSLLKGNQCVSLIDKIYIKEKKRKGWVTS